MNTKTNTQKKIYVSLNSKNVDVVWHSFLTVFLETKTINSEFILYLLYLYDNFQDKIIQMKNRFLLSCVYLPNDFKKKRIYNEQGGFMRQIAYSWQ